MAREIRDTLAQAFTGILVHMGAISRLATTNPEAVQTHSNTVQYLARSGLTEARRSVAALRPQLLEEGNLWTARLSCRVCRCFRTRYFPAFTRYIQTSAYRSHQSRHRKWIPKWSNGCPSFVY